MACSRVISLMKLLLTFTFTSAFVVDNGILENFKKLGHTSKDAADGNGGTSLFMDGDRGDGGFTITKQGMRLNNNLTFKTDIERLMNIVKKTIKVPRQITCSFYQSKPDMKFYSLDDCKIICKDFTYVESVKEFHCFRKTIKSGDNESILLKVQFAK